MSSPSRLVHGFLTGGGRASPGAHGDRPRGAPPFLRRTRRRVEPGGGPPHLARDHPGRQGGPLLPERAVLHGHLLRHPPDQGVAVVGIAGAVSCGQRRSTPMSGRSVISSQNRCRGSSAHQVLTRPASLSRYALAGSVSRTAARSSQRPLARPPQSLRRRRAAHAARRSRHSTTPPRLEQPLDPVLDPFDRYRLPGRRAAGRHHHAVAFNAEHVVRPAGDRPDLLPDERFKECAGVRVCRHGSRLST